MKTFFLASLWMLFLSAAGSLVWASEGRAPSVVVSIKPIHALVAGVMQGVAEPQLLVTRGGSPHGYVLRPSEARALANADLVIWVGHSLESFLAKPLATLGRQARQLELGEALEEHLLPLRELGSWDGHGHDVERADHGEEHHPQAGLDHKNDRYAGPVGDHGQAAGELNLHLWLSPLLASQIVLQTAATLSEIDPGHQVVYRQNAEQLQLRLNRLHHQLVARLEPVKDVPYIVFHDAYQYFENAYGLNAVGSITIDPERKPGARRIAEIRDKIKLLRARCVFSEPQFEPRLVATIIEGTGARTGILDPLGTELAEGPESYFQLMSNLADNLLAGLQER